MNAVIKLRINVRPKKIAIPVLKIVHLHSPCKRGEKSELLPTLLSTILSLLVIVELQCF